MTTSQKFTSGSRLGKYVPTLNAARFWGSAYDSDHFFARSDVFEMRKNPYVLQGLRMLYAPVLTAKWKVTATDPRVQAFVDESLKRFFRNDAPRALSMLEFGTSGGEAVARQDPEGLWQWERLKDIHIDDMRALDLEGEPWGVAVVNGVRGQKGAIHLKFPAALWFANEAEFGNYYGRPRLAGAWRPWKEMTGKHGAYDIRRTWMMRCAFRGGMMRYPDNSTLAEQGVETDNQEIAMEIVEKAETGFVQAIPSDKFPPEQGGGFKWEYIDAASVPEPSGLEEYVGNLGQEIWLGMGIPPEVIEASETGSGYSGRKVPFEAFLKSEDAIVDNLIQTFDRQWLRHAVAANFGARARYKVEPISLVPEPQQQPGAQPGQQQGTEGGGAPPPGGGAQGGGQPPPDSGGGGAGGWVPYTGPHGGRGQKNPATGAVKYGLSLDASGHEHRGEGPGGGQFVGRGGEDGGEGEGDGGDDPEPAPAAGFAARQAARDEARARLDDVGITDERRERLYAAGAAVIDLTPDSDPEAVRSAAGGLLAAWDADYGEDIAALKDAGATDRELALLTRQMEKARWAVGKAAAAALDAAAKYAAARAELAELEAAEPEEPEAADEPEEPDYPEEPEEPEDPGDRPERDDEVTYEIDAGGRLVMYPEPRPAYASDAEHAAAVAAWEREKAEYGRAAKEYPKAHAAWQKQTAALEKQYERDHGAWEKAEARASAEHEKALAKWEAAREKAGSKASALEERAGELLAAINHAADEHFDEALSELLADAEQAVRDRLDEEEAADPEPEEEEDDGVQLSHVRLATTADPWQPYLGLRGPNRGKQVGWRNAVSGEVLYQQEHPGGHGMAEDAAPAPAAAGAKQQAQPQPQTGKVAAARAAVGKLFGFLDRATDVPGARLAKRAIGGALKAVKAAQGKLYGVMERRYGSKAAKMIFAAAQVTGSNPAIFPLWFVALPGSTLLAQIPLMGVAEALKQGRRAVKATVGLSADGMTDERAKQLAEWLLKRLAAEAARALEPHKDTLAAALKGIDEGKNDGQPAK
jgi:hypothetical protein